MGTIKNIRAIRVIRGQKIPESTTGGNGACETEDRLHLRSLRCLLFKMHAVPNHAEH
jgi:hypothetical protein